MSTASFHIKVTADSTSPITQVKFQIDSVDVKTISTYPYEFDATGVATGLHEIKAIALDSSGNQSDRRINVGVGVPYSTPTPSPTPTPTSTP